MKMTDKRKKQLTLAGLGIVSVALVIAIASQFRTEVPKDTENLPTQAVSSEVTPNAVIPDSSAEPKKVSEVSAAPIEPTETPTVKEGEDTGKSTGTDQSIQAEPTKPAAPTETPAPKKESETTDASKKPEYTPTETVKTESQEPAAGAKNDKGQVWFPGFGWVDDEGGGVEQGTVGNEGDQLTGNKVGEMD